MSSKNKKKKKNRMKILKKVIWSILGILILSAIGGYIYFDQKFSPDKN